MESQPQNPEFRHNPENFHLLICNHTENVKLRMQLLISDRD